MPQRLPRYVVIKASHDYNAGYVRFNDGGYVAVQDFDQDVFSPLVKIEVERSHMNYVHLRFCNSNRYWSFDEKSKLVVAESKKPDEDTSKPSCTLFELHWFDNVPQYFCLSTGYKGERLWVNTLTDGTLTSNRPFDAPTDGLFTFVDWSTLVKLPKHVAFRGSNGKYLRSIWQDGLPYQQFTSDDPNDKSSGYEVLPMGDGHVRIKAKYNDRIWRRSPNWIWADSYNWAPDDDRDLLFWPVKVDGNTIALRNAGNNFFCKPLSVDNKTDCLNAAAETMTTEARLGVKELVQSRKIYNVRYHMEDARIFDETPFVAGSSVLYNESNETATQAVEIPYEEVTQYCFSRSVTLSAEVSTTIEANVLGIVDVSVEVSYGISGTLTWDETKEIHVAVTGKGEIPVPPKSKVVITYVGTKATCNVPYSYTQDDHNSSDGTFTSTDMYDGIYTGVNSYNFNFVVHKSEPLSTSIKSSSSP